MENMRNIIRIKDVPSNTIEEAIIILKENKKLLETLNLKDEGYIDLYKNAGYDIKIEENDNITIYKYNKDIDLKYIDKGEDK